MEDAFNASFFVGDEIADEFDEVFVVECAVIVVGAGGEAVDRFECSKQQDDIAGAVWVVFGESVDELKHFTVGVNSPKIRGHDDEIGDEVEVFVVGCMPLF